jgi:1,4-dihydroxy-2-naphthoate octaprenyltransferase
MIAAFIMSLDLIGIFKQDEQAMLDPYLKKLALGTFLFTLLFGIGMLI